MDGQCLRPRFGGPHVGPGRAEKRGRSSGRKPQDRPQTTGQVGRILQCAGADAIAARTGCRIVRGRARRLLGGARRIGCWPVACVAGMSAAASAGCRFFDRLARSRPTCASQVGAAQQGEDRQQGHTQAKHGRYSCKGRSGSNNPRFSPICSQERLEGPSPRASDSWLQRCRVGAAAFQAACPVPGAGCDGRGREALMLNRSTLQANLSRAPARPTVEMAIEQRNGAHRPAFRGPRAGRGATPRKPRKRPDQTGGRAVLP